MFIAHLPAAYIALRILTARRPTSRPVAVATLVGGIAPDVDLLWFYLVDARRHHHHDDLSHRPALWSGALAITLALSRRNARARPLAALAAAALLHLALDSVMGRIAWAWPLSDVAQPLVTVPAQHPYWQINFLTHWSFGIEIAICMMAVILLAQKEKPRDTSPGSPIS